VFPAKYRIKTLDWLKIVLYYENTCYDTFRFESVHHLGVIIMLIVSVMYGIKEMLCKYLSVLIWFFILSMATFCNAEELQKYELLGYIQ
jgi:hypothetical protein